MKDLIFTGLLAIVFSMAGLAQENTDPPATEEEVVEIPEQTYLKKSALSINLGTTGFGLEYAYNINAHLNARARASYFSINDYTVELEFDNRPVQIVGNATVTNIDLVIEYLPFTRSSLKLVGGLSYFVDGGGSVQVIYNEELEYGDIVLSPEEIGDLTITMDYSGLAPYAGFGFGRAVPKKRVGIGFEAGAYYAGSPDLTLTATEMFGPTATEEEEQLRENFSSYRWLPYITLRLAIKL